jgi:hypothetical protein
MTPKVKDLTRSDCLGESKIAKSEAVHWECSIDLSRATCDNSAA